MRFYEQFSAGDRVEVDDLAGGILDLGLGVSSGDRGTVLSKSAGNWLDPVSEYLVEMDYPCVKEAVRISGRNLRKVSPESEQVIEHKKLSVGVTVSRSVYEPSRSGTEASIGGILLPDMNDCSNWIHLQGAVLDKRPGKRRNEPDSYLVEWSHGETTWHRETELIVPARSS